MKQQHTKDKKKYKDNIGFFFNTISRLQDGFLRSGFERHKKNVDNILCRIQAQKDEQTRLSEDYKNTFKDDVNLLGTMLNNLNTRIEENIGGLNKNLKEANDSLEYTKSNFKKITPDFEAIKEASNVFISSGIEYILSSSEYQRLLKRSELGGQKGNLLTKFIDRLESANDLDTFKVILQEMEQELNKKKGPERSVIYSEKRAGLPIFESGGLSIFERAEPTASVLNKFIKYANSKVEAMEQNLKKGDKVFEEIYKVDPSLMVGMN